MFIADRIRTVSHRAAFEPFKLRCFRFDRGADGTDYRLNARYSSHFDLQNSCRCNKAFCVQKHIKILLDIILNACYTKQNLKYIVFSVNSFNIISNRKPHAYQEAPACLYL